MYYPPIELINFSGKMDKALETAGKDNNPYWIIGTFIVLRLLWGLIAWRRYMRQSGY